MRGVHIPFNEIPVQNWVPAPYKMSDFEKENAQLEVDKFLNKGPKQEREFRVILDLTHLNKWVKYEHFKMFSLNTAKDLMTPLAWLGSVDLKQAYYSVAVAKDHRKYLCFQWEDVRIYVFT